ncbi:MAG: HslU--HslV peptidase proteolytic subunit, partial [Idiomarina sp.]|nr:HslU--HslV peptidase proteolytic subunit [Idiomarina sp.]
SLPIAGDICVYTNGNQTIEEQESIVEDKITKGKS